MLFQSSQGLVSQAVFKLAPCRRLLRYGFQVDYPRFNVDTGLSTAVNAWEGGVMPVLPNGTIAVFNGL